MQLRNENVLVTGAAGFIPSFVVDLLVEKGANVTAIDNLKDGRLENLEKSMSKIRFEKIDVRDRDKVDDIVKGNSVVFHLASNANVPYSVEDPRYDFETNALGTFNVLKASLENNVQKVIYSSTAAVYGEPERTPIKETDRLNPISPYGSSKLAGELAGFAFYNTYHLPFIALRIFNTYGPRQPRYVMYDLIKKLMKNPKKLEVLGTGEQVRDYCYVLDTAQAFIDAIENEAAVGETFNIAGGHPISIKELVALLLDVLDLTDAEVYYTGKSWPGDINTLVADISKIRKMIGWNPSFDLRKGVQELCQELTGKGIKRS